MKASCGRKRGNTHCGFSPFSRGQKPHKSVLSKTNLVILSFVSYNFVLYSLVYIIVKFIFLFCLLLLLLFIYSFCLTHSAAHVLVLFCTSSSLIVSFMCIGPAWLHERLAELAGRLTISVKFLLVLFSCSLWLRESFLLAGLLSAGWLVYFAEFRFFSYRCVVSFGDT